jgi:L-arabinonolactonase
MPELVGSLALCVNGDVLVALRSSVRRFNPATEKLELVTAPESGNPQMRLNDGRVDRRGRFWVGSMNDVTRGPEGTLYRLDGSGGCVPCSGNLRPEQSCVEPGQPHDVLCRTGSAHGLRV